MTVLLVLGVNPSNGSRPYVIMGSDTKRIGLEIKTLDKEDESNDYKKVYQIKDKLIGVTGRFEDYFHSDFLEFTLKNDTSMEELVPVLFEYVKKHISVTDYTEAKIKILIGTVTNNVPMLGVIEVRKQSFENAYYEVKKIEKRFDHYKNFHLNEKSFNEFREQVDKNQKFKNVRKRVNKYLKESASYYSDTSNQNIEIKSIGK